MYGWLRVQAGMMGAGPIPDHILRMQMQRLHLQAMTMGGVQQAGLMMPGAPMPGAMPMPMGPYGHLPHLGIPAMGMPGEPSHPYHYTTSTRSSPVQELTPLFLAKDLLAKDQCFSSGFPDRQCWHEQAMGVLRSSQVLCTAQWVSSAHLVHVCARIDTASSGVLCSHGFSDCVV